MRENPYIKQVDVDMVPATNKMAYAWEQGYLAGLIDARRTIMDDFETLSGAVEGLINDSDERFEKIQGE